MNHLRRLPLRPAASVALSALFALALSVPSLSRTAAAQQAAPQAPAGPNGKIVFESDQSGDQEGINDIYTMDADGKRQTRLTTDPAHDGSAVWSPRGDKIAFISSRRGIGFEIYLMNADGSNQRPLRADNPVYTMSVEWSPDGTRLAYVSGDQAYVIEAFEADGSDSTDAPWSLSDARLAGSSDIEVSWSPDGSRLVVRNSQACGGCSDLYTVNADGSGRTQLTSAAGFETHARWSPNGSRVAYIGDRATGVGLYTIDAAGVGPEQLLSSNAWIGVPAWSPDGSRIAFVAFPSGINVVNANGSGETPLTDLAGTSNAPFWSPDGQKVAFQNGGDIYVVNGDGSSRRASNYTKTRRATEYASSWQRISTP